MISSIISRLVILVFGTLYPAYASYKAVRTKNVKEYVKWMMYWIVFALFTCAETFTDVFCSFWFPFYYEFKVILVLWLLSPATKGSSILYRKFVHPMLTKREQEIDDYIAKAKEQGYHTVLTLGSKGVNYATTVIMQTAIKGGGGLVNQLRRSYSLSDISADMDALAEMNRIKALPEDELDLGDTPMPIADPRLRRSRGYSPRRSASGSGRVEMYFPEVDVNVRQRSTRPRETGIPLSHIRSNEDVSSGYSSAEMLYSGQPPPSEAQEPLVRTSSVGSSRVTRTKVTRGGAIPKRPTAAEDNLSWSESEGSDSGTQEEYFYDVPSASPSESNATLPSATLSQPATPQSMGGDFKSHLPVALVCELQESEKNTECGDNVQHLTTSEKQGALINHEGGTLQNVIEAFQAEKDNTEDKKDILKELKCVITEENIESADNLQNLTTSEEQAALISLSTNEERDIVEMLMEVLQADKDNLEELKSLVCEVTTSNDESMLLGTGGKETWCPEEETPSFDDVSFPDVMKTSDGTLAQDVDSIPTTVEREESKVEENLSTNMPQEQDESEFYDTENDVSQNIISSTEVSHFPAVSPVDYTPVSIDEIHDDSKLTENKTQKLVDECRAGRYHKHPAPCPPPQPNTEPLGSNTWEEENRVEMKLVLEPVAADRKSPSPRRESSVTKSPQPSPCVTKKNVVHDILEGKSTASIEQTLPSVPVDIFEDAVNMQYPVQATRIEKLDVKSSSSDHAKPKVFASPNQKRKESKPKQESNIMSRFFSKPKHQLASFFPFLSTALTTSLTSLDGDLRAQDRARSSSVVGTTQTRSDYMSVPPELPPRRKTPDHSGESFRDDNTTQGSNAGGNRINIREMSHSPPRRHVN